MTSGEPSTLELQDQHDRRIIRLALKREWPSCDAADRRRIDELLAQLKPK